MSRTEYFLGLAKICIAWGSVIATVIAPVTLVWFIALRFGPGTEVQGIVLLIAAAMTIPSILVGVFLSTITAAIFLKTWGMQ